MKIRVYNSTVTIIIEPMAFFPQPNNQRLTNQVMGVMVSGSDSMIGRFSLIELIN